MAQLFVLTVAAPAAVFFPPIIREAVFAGLIASDCDECGFNDLGKLLFGGLVLAIIVGIAVSLLHRRMSEKRSAQNEFVSIRSSRRKE